MRLNYFTATCLTIVVLITNISATPAYDRVALKDFIKSQPDKEDWGISYVKVNGHTYLISVDSSLINGSSPEAKIKAMKEAEILAQDQLLKYLYGLQSESIKEMSSTVITVSNKHGTSIDEVNRISEMIKEGSSGVLKNISSFYRWKNDGNYKYFVAVGIGFQKSVETGNN